jgi:DNA ligase-1
MDGKKQTTSTKILEGKNLGKTNATNAYEQALSEAESKWKKQQDKGYRETIDATSSAKDYLPMLAKSFDKDGGKIQYPCYFQPKLDGIRCISYWDGQNVVLLTRKGKPFNSIPHIEAALLKVFKKNPTVVLDGELYSDKLGFQKITSIVRKSKCIDADVNKIEYHVYDIVIDKPFRERTATIQKLNVNKPIVCVYTGTLNNANEVAPRLDEYEKAGYEGIMLRNSGANYESDKRSSHLQKVKSFKDAEFEIIGGESGVGKFEGMCTFICKTKKNQLFRCMPTGTEEQRREFLTNIDKYIGEMLTVKYFELTEDGLPRFPVGIGLRNYEN